MAINPPIPPARRRARGLPRGTRRTVALAATVLACIAAASAEAGSGALVHIGSRVVSVPGSQISAQGDVPATKYTLRAAPGQSQSITLQGISIRALLGLAGVALNTVSSVTVGSGASALSPADITDPPPFRDGPALLTLGGDGSTRYFRPVRDASDVNAADYIKTPAGQSIDVFVEGGARTPGTAGSSQLRVTASAAPTEASVGQTVSFTAIVENPPAGASLTYSWSFGDGATGLGAAPNHAYAADGDYPAAVTVSGGQGQSVAASVVVHVGRPHRRSSGSGLGSTNAAGGGAGGAGTGKGGTGGGNGTGGNGVTQPRPQPKPAVRKPRPPAHPVGAAAGPAGAPPPAGGLQAVRGVLLADAGSPFDLRLSPPPPSGGAGAAHKSSGGATGIGIVVGGLALALAIACSGGLAERRRVNLRAP